MGKAIRLKPTTPKIIVGAVPDKSLPWAISWDAVMLLGPGLEKLTLEPYVCPAGVPTNGWGETDGVYIGMPPWTKEYADQRFVQAIAEYAAIVQKHVTVPLNANQLGALVILVYNIGEEAFAASTVLRMLNKGDYQSAARAFGLFDEATIGGKKQVVNGLVIRRAHEMALFLSPLPDDGHVAPPQEVAPESSAVKSPINVASVTTVGAGAVSLLSGLGDKASTASDTLAAVGANADKATTALTQVQGAAHGIRGALEEFDIPPGVAVGTVVIVAALVTMYFRRQQRNAGRA